jgi:S1-C subfamily serine protease
MLIGGGKLLGLGLLFLALLSLRPGSVAPSGADGDRGRGVAAALVHREEAAAPPSAGIECFEEMFDESLSALAHAEAGLEGSLVRFEDERREMQRLLDEKERLFEREFLERLQAERGRFERAQLTVEANSARLAMLSASLERDVETMKRRMIYPTVQLRGNGTVGSGVIVYSEPQPDAGAASAGPSGDHVTLLLTAHHVVLEVLGPASYGKVLEDVHVLDEKRPTTGESFRARLILFDPKRDIALLQLESTERFPNVVDLTPSAELREVDVFSRAYAVGCPLGNHPLPTLGEVSSKLKPVGDQIFWMLNAPTFFGNSGGGVYLERNSKLIGISSMIYTYGKTNPTVVPHMGLFVPLESVYEWLDGEGYGFVHRREPVPPAERWKLFRGTGRGAGDVSRGGAAWGGETSAGTPSR